MKRLSFLLAFGLFLITNSFKPAGEIQWMGFNDGYKLARKTGKIMLVDVYTDWCGWCKRMDRDAYAKSEVAEIVGKDFVAVKFNPELDGSYLFDGKTYSGNDLAGAISEYKLSGYPTTVFLNAKTSKKKVVGGYQDAAAMRTLMAQAMLELNGKK